MFYFIVASQWIVIFLLFFEGLFVFRNMKTRTHYYLYMNCVAMLISSCGHMMSLFAESESAYFATVLVSWGGKIAVTISFLFFCAKLCGHDLSNIITALMLGLGSVTYIVVIKTRETDLFFKGFYKLTLGKHTFYKYELGVWGIAWDIFVMALIVLCLITLILSTAREKNMQKRKQLQIIITALVCEIIIGFLSTFPIHDLFDMNQIGFSVCASLILYAIFKKDLMKTEFVTKDYLIDKLSAGVIAMDTNEDVAYYNQTALQVFPSLALDPQSVVTQIQESIAENKPLFIGNSIYSFEERILEPNSDDHIKLYVLNDSTVHYYHLQELEEARQMAEAANHSKTYFLTNMSHEIRTPINTVLGMDEMILRESTQSSVQDYARDIQSAGRTLLSLINDILDLSKIESGKMELFPVEYDVASMLYDLINMTRYKTKEQSLSFHVSISSDIPARLWGDDIRIKQVLMNLLSNAVKYTPSGSVYFRVSLNTDEMTWVDGDDEVLLHFEVEDTGRGIKPEEMEILFSEFERIEDSNNRKIEGTGLGISITRRLLALMDSELDVQSEYGRGSLFSFDLKQKVVEKEPIQDFDKKMEHMTSDTYTYTKTFLAPDATILVADDNSMNRKVFVSLLAQTQMKITEAGSGLEAIKLASKTHFDIIFMDHMMPGIDGIEAMQEIKAEQNGPCADTPIIVLTANAVNGWKEKYLEAGFDGFISKPISPDNLEKVIRNTLSPEKLIPISSTSAPAMDTPASPIADPADFPVIFGVDWEVAMMRIQNKASLRDLMDGFVDSLNQQADKLQSFKDGLPDTMPDYRIQVHGMKSAAGYVGIFPLSGMAAVLEQAASNEDMDTILKIHDVFLREWRIYKDRLADYLNQDDVAEADKEEIKKDVLEMLLNMLSDAMGKMDIETADNTIKKLSSYKLPETAAREFDTLKAAVTQLDQKLVAQTLLKIHKEDL